jgi:hypothetical protein
MKQSTANHGKIRTVMDKVVQGKTAKNAGGATPTNAGVGPMFSKQLEHGITVHIHLNTAPHSNHSTEAEEND